jgi:hypothetical protein
VSVLPALGVAALAYPLWAVLAADDQAGQDYSSHIVPIAVLVWFLAGVGFYAYLRLIATQNLERIGSALAADATPNLEPQTSR